MGIFVVSCLFLFTGAKSNKTCQQSLAVQEELFSEDLYAFTTTSPPSVHNKSSKTHRTYNNRAPRSTKAKKEQAEKNFLKAFQDNNYQEMIEIVENFPFLKTIRFDHSALPDNPISKEHQKKWMPLGWSPPQVAAYEKDIEKLIFFLELGFNPRTKKRTGGVSLEHNPLHIAIKVYFANGVSMTLKHVGFEPMDRDHLRNRFIDEKNNDKQTPWILAIQSDLKIKRTSFTARVARFRPSGYVESFVHGRLVDGYEYAKMSRVPKIIQIARKSLEARNYELYRPYREREGESSHRTSAPYTR